MKIKDILLSGMMVLGVILITICFAQQMEPVSHGTEIKGAAIFHLITTIAALIASLILTGTAIYQQSMYGECKTQPVILLVLISVLIITKQLTTISSIVDDNAMIPEGFDKYPIPSECVVGILFAVLSIASFIFGAIKNADEREGAKIGYCIASLIFVIPSIMDHANFAVTPYGGSSLMILIALLFLGFYFVKDESKISNSSSYLRKKYHTINATSFNKSKTSKVTHSSPAENVNNSNVTNPALEVSSDTNDTDSNIDASINVSSINSFVELKELYKNGKISSEDFERRKKEIINLIIKK